MAGRRTITWTAAAVVVSGLAACQVKSPDPTPTPEPKGPLSAAGAPAFSEITAACTALPADLKVVKIQITDVSPKKLGHTTGLFAAKPGGEESDNKKLADIAETLLKTDNPTRLDIDARPYLKKPGDVILVEVQLDDPAASFAPVPAALTAGNGPGGTMFCIKDKDHRILPKPGDRTARFYVQYVQSKTPLFGKFNLFLLVKDGPFITPTILDPKIHNSG